LWVAFVDLDRFKVINDTLGHKAGDFVLNTMAERLRAVLRETDTIARIGGDEFVLILRGPEHADLSATTLQRIMDVIGEPMTLEGRDFSLSCSIGIAAYPADGITPELLVERADIAMYRAKESGRSNFQFFTAEMNLRLLERVHMEQALRHAIAHNEFELHYQPQVDLRNGQIVGMEALIRWNHPGLGPVSPARFIGLAEESGLIGPIGAWVLRTACAQNKAWQRAGLRPVHIAVNFSARLLMESTLVQSIGAALADTGLDPAFLEIEITESSVMADVEYSIEVLRSLKKLGVHMSIDDFGTGYSSLAYLKRFPIDVLKIDQSFVQDVESDPDSAAIVLSIISLAHSLRLQVIAEGVETRAQLAYLQRHNCDMIQGFYFCKPVPAAEFEAILRAEKCLPPDASLEHDPRDTLLVVDDEASALELASIVLGQDGYRILTASSASAAFELLAAYRVGVVLCDQRMPTMEGVEFLSRIKGLYPSTARIMLSGYDESETVIDAVNRGAIFGYLVKPCNPSVLRDSVREGFRFYRECLLQGAALARCEQQ
jgi:diguanylate cyclase (GGDEF)-like protein